ncbi:MAG: DUF2809 domain-containing protein [Cyanobacteria bacterium J06632_22]
MTLSRSHYRLFLALGIALMVALGLGSKAYGGIGARWVNNYSGDIVYEVFWIWLVGWVWPRCQAWRVAIAVFTLTAIIEFTQLIPFPSAWQTHILWRLLLGTSFSWWDFPYYAIGSVFGGWSLAYLQQQCKARHQLPKG